MIAPNGSRKKKKKKKTLLPVIDSVLPMRNLYASAKRCQAARNSDLFPTGPDDGAA